VGPRPGEEGRKIMFENRIKGRSKTKRKERKSKTEKRIQYRTGEN
jgi:hypothetical protein